MVVHFSNILFRFLVLIRCWSLTMECCTDLANYKKDFGNQLWAQRHNCPSNSNLYQSCCDMCLIRRACHLKSHAEGLNMKMLLKADGTPSMTAGNPGASHVSGS